MRESKDNQSVDVVEVWGFFYMGPSVDEIEARSNEINTCTIRPMTDEEWIKYGPLNPKKTGFISTLRTKNL